MFTRRRIIILLLATVLLVLGWVLFVVFRPAPEPSYQGKTLSAWLEAMAARRPVPQAAAVAIRAIGTNAIPYLLQWIQDSPPPWMMKMYHYSVTRMKSPLFERQVSQHDLRQANIFLAFEILGPAASSAIPELTKLMADSSRNDTAYRAAIILGAMGPTALPSLIDLLKNRQPQMLIGFHALAKMGTNALPALPLMVQCLADNDEEVVGSAINALGELHLQPDLVVPALTNFLMNSQPGLCVIAAEALGKFGPSARPAVPLLQRLLNDSIPMVREYATNAVFKINPEALTTETGK